MLIRTFFLSLLLAAAPAQAARTILVFGDSLSSGYGLPQRSGWVTLLEKRLAAEGYDYKVVNASISGETTVGGKNRIASILRRHEPDILLLQLGANDGLRGARIPDIRRHLSAIVTASKRNGTKVVLIGMRLPPNYGREYTEGFQAVFAEVARQQGVALVPFLLDGFAEKRSLFQHDGIHPKAEAQALMLDNVWPVLQPLLLRSG
ncbi:MAG TPA: arylesterase [Burkholderiales bacterium]|jgi:acyl-CoA thioesterase-1|nr:arylesterase [Burkholderiales bacterium]